MLNEGTKLFLQIIINLVRLWSDEKFGPTCKMSVLSGTVSVLTVIEPHSEHLSPIVQRGGDSIILYNNCLLQEQES